MTAARFLTFEGGEGAGKSTQLRLLVEALGRAGIAAIATREPGGTPGAEAIRKLLVEGEPGRWDAMTEALLLSAARREHVERVIRPALAAGRWVISDRFADSTMAYQGYAHGLGRAPVEALYGLAVGDLKPDLTLILDIEAEAGLARAASRNSGGDRYERMGAAFHRKLREGFLDIARREPLRCAVIPAAGDVAATYAAIVAVLRERLKIALS